MESNKFSLLINQDHSPDSKQNSTKKIGLSDKNKKEEHKCKIFGTLKPGELESLDTKARFKEYPAKVDNFIGRQKEMFDVIYNVCHHRLVTIIGLPGIGKTSLSKNAVHYIVDRKIFK